MAFAFRWRHFWARRSPLRLILTAICLLGAVGTELAALFVPYWPAGFNLALSSADHPVLAVGPAGLMLLVGLAFLVIAVLAVIVPVPRRFPYATMWRSAIAPVSVYLDQENQHLSHAELDALMAALRGRLKGRRADLLYYCDAALYSKGGMYQALWRFGFRPMDVPHKQVGAKNVDNIVDFELSLHAYERALLARRPQDIILIAGDQHYLPLIYRLRARGHQVTIWARQPPESFKSLARYLGVAVTPFATLFAGAPGVAAQKVPASQRGQGKQRKQQNQSQKQPLPQPAPVSDPMQAIVQALSQTKQIIEQANGEGRSFSAAKSRIGADATVNLSRIGFKEGHRVDNWLRQLVAVEVLKRSEQSTTYDTGTAEVDGAARQLLEFLREVAAVAHNEALMRPDPVVNLTKLAARIAGGAANPGAHGDADALRGMLGKENPGRDLHVLQLCRWARLLGMVRFSEAAGNTIVVERERTGQQNDTAQAPQQAAGDDPVRTDTSTGAEEEG